MLAEIVLPHGTNKIVIRDIPALFADAIYPPVPDGTPKQITELRKFPLTKQNAYNWCGNKDAPFPVSLTDADLSSLHSGAWANLPEIKLPMIEPDWEPYRIAIDSNPPNGWRLEWLHKTPEIFQMVMHHKAKGDYLDQVCKASMTDLLKPLSSATYSPIPSATGELLMDCIVTLENFIVFAKTLHVGVTVDKPEPPPVVTAGVSGGVQTKEQRQDRRLQACIDAGLPMNTKAALSRLPDGVGKVADSEPVTRQSFSTDVKAALKRRESAKREGVTMHRA